MRYHAIQNTLPYHTIPYHPIQEILRCAALVKRSRLWVINHGIAPVATAATRHSRYCFGLGIADRFWIRAVRLGFGHQRRGYTTVNLSCIHLTSCGHKSILWPNARWQPAGELITLKIVTHLETCRICFPAPVSVDLDPFPSISIARTVVCGQSFNTM